MDEPALRAYILQHRDDEEAFQAFLGCARSRPPVAVQEPGEPLSHEVLERIQQERTRQQRKETE
jgi:hypothetical protein